MRTIALVAILISATAHADDEQVEVQRMRFVERGDELTVTTTSLGKLFDLDAFQALSSGFPSNVLIRVWVYPKDSSDPVGGVVIVRSAVYDLWDEVYNVKPCEGCKVVKVKSPAEALKLLTSIVDVPVAKLDRIPVGKDNLHYVAIRADLNPVSKETLAEIRRWLSQGTGGGLDRGGAFFGSFVSVFVNPKIAEADRVIRVRSQPFYRPN